MLPIEDSREKKREDLKARRNALFEKFSQNPHDLHFALEIKAIDDEIAEVTKKMTTKTFKNSFPQPTP